MLTTLFLAFGMTHFWKMSCTLDMPVFTVGRLSSPPYFMYGDIDTIEIAANRLSGDLVDPGGGTAKYGLYRYVPL